MRPVTALSVRRKLIAMLMATAGAAVVVASAATMIYDAHRSRVALREDLTSVADIAGANSVAAMTFGDVNASQEILEQLSHKPALVAAALYDREGRLFAAYRRGGAEREPLPPSATTERTALTGDRSTVTRAVRLSGEIAGFIYVASDLSENRARLARQAAVLAAKQVGERHVITRQVKWDRPLAGVNAVVVTETDQKKVRRVLQSAALGAILSIGEGAAFASSGGVIALVIEDRKVRFDIDVDVANAAGLKVSSKLLALTRVIHSDKAKGERP